MVTVREMAALPGFPGARAIKKCIFIVCTREKGLRVMSVKITFGIVSLLAVLSCTPSSSLKKSEPVLLDRQECDKYGFSMAECRQIYQSGVSMAKIHKLLGAGISISEYFEKPWVNLNISEKKWIRKRRSGLSQKDLEMMYRAGENAESDPETGKQSTEEIQGPAGE